MRNITAGISSHQPCKVLIISQNDAFKGETLTVVDQHFQGKIEATYAQSIQEGIEMIEADQKAYDLILFEYQGTSQTMVRALMELATNAAFIMCTPDEAVLKNAKFSHPEFELISSLTLPASLPSALNRFFPHQIVKSPSRDENFSKVEPNILLLTNPLIADVFVKLNEGHYIKIFKQHDSLSHEELEKLNQKKGIQTFYFLKSDYEHLVLAQARKIEVMATAQPPPSKEEAMKAVHESLEILKDLVSRSGFTPTAQTIAKSSVAMTLKVMGSKPRLNNILTELKKKEGSYITSHSVMLGQVACAIAYKIGWSSSATFLKLSLAAFIHDIALPNNKLAAVESYHEAAESKDFTHEDLMLIKMHTMRAAEYALRISEIPPDVDQIVSQHHERPDGQGFPKGISGKQISPLGALFIMAHEIINYALYHPDQSIETYLSINAPYYSNGPFRKIHAGLMQKK